MPRSGDLRHRLARRGSCRPDLQTPLSWGFSLYSDHGRRDRTRAQSRLRVLTPIFRTFPTAKPRFNGGDYEMEYIKEAGLWKIYKFKYVHNFAVTFEPDGSVTPGYSTAPSGREDGPTTWYHPWPETGVLPFHYPNPVSGKFPPDITGAEHYWIGNWPGEFGKTGHGPR
jgi:hypothetical protein